ncbi:MAG: hypothetical protein ACR2NP_14605 [Pirellulaceae bacterium]
MHASQRPFGWLSRSILSLVVAVSATCAITGSAEARQWTVEGRPVDAVFLDFNGSQVLLGTADGEQHVVYLQHLGDADVQYVRSLLEVREMTSQIRTQEARTQIELANLRLEQEKFRSRWSKVWYIEMQGPNGVLFYRYYRGNNSAIAEDAARYEFPHARILITKKLYGGNWWHGS